MVEVGDRLQGTAWGCALRAAGTALPATRHCLDFFLCLDALPSPGPSRLGNSLISLIPASAGAEPPPGPPHQGYHARTWQASDAWAPVVRDTQQQATKAAGHSQEAKQQHRHQSTTAGQGPAEWLIWAGGSFRHSGRAPLWQTPSLLVFSQGSSQRPPKPLVESQAGVAVAPQFSTGPPPPAVGEGGSLLHNKGANVNGTLIPRQARLPAPDFPQR